MVMVINNSRLNTPIRWSYMHHVRTLERHWSISECLLLVELHRKRIMMYQTHWIGSVFPNFKMISLYQSMVSTPSTVSQTVLGGQVLHLLSGGLPIVTTALPLHWPPLAVLLVLERRWYLGVGLSVPLSLCLKHTIIFYSKSTDRKLLSFSLAT